MLTKQKVKKIIRQGYPETGWFALIAELVSDEILTILGNENQTVNQKEELLTKKLLLFVPMKANAKTVTKNLLTVVS